MTRWRASANKAALTAPLVLTVFCALGLGLVYVGTVRTTTGRNFGNASLRGAVVTNSNVVDAVDKVLGGVSVATLLGGVAAIALIALVRLRRMAGVTAVGLLVAANASTWLLKTHLLTRPDLGLREITPVTRNSLPSGHTTAVFSVVVALLIVLPVRGRRLIAVAGGAAAVVTALATMSAGWHRAGDSIAAFLVVGAWAGIAAVVNVLAADSTTPVRVSAPRASDGPRRWLIAMTAGSTGVGLLLASVLVLVRPLRTSTAGAVSAFVASGILIVAAAVAVLMAALLVLSGLIARPGRMDDGPDQVATTVQVEPRRADHSSGGPMSMRRSASFSAVVASPLWSPLPVRIDAEPL